MVNEGSAPKRLTVFSFVEFCLWNASDDMTNFQRNFSTGDRDRGSAIYHKTEIRERRNHYSFYSVNAPVIGFDTDKQRSSVCSAASMLLRRWRGQVENSMASGWPPIASHCVQADLAPGDRKDFIFVLGYVENALDEKWESPGVINKAKAQELMQSFNGTDAFESAMEELAAYWNKLLSKYTLSSHDQRLQRMVNIWNPYQCMVTFNLSRSASYFESGIGRGIGFRDSNQDILGFVHLVPERARERILDLASTQLEDGGAYHQYQPLTKRGNNEIGGGFNDDPLWLILSTAAYIKEQVTRAFWTRWCRSTATSP